MLDSFELPCMDSRKSFYGKAVVVKWDYTVCLFSYGTLVCSFDGETFRRHWAGYSATTMRHVNSFIKFYGIPAPGGKSWWTSLPVER